MSTNFILIQFLVKTIYLKIIDMQKQQVFHVHMQQYLCDHFSKTYKNVSEIFIDNIMMQKSV